MKEAEAHGLGLAGQWVDRTEGMRRGVGFSFKLTDSIDYD
jgi:hypothetical protein